MTPEHWARIQELFDRALDMDEAQRRAFLDDTCSGDSQLRSQVEELILANDGAGLAIEELISDAAEKTRRSQNHGDQIGAYKLVRLLGEGGMGSVYLAERADREYRQLVALKIVKNDFVNQEILQRFLSERQILANLNHPNIARLLDGGTTAKGLPYLVMEYIEGEPIDAYCDRHRLSTEARLKIFRSVCTAVHVAHQNLVVHRDLKPSNIMVLPDGTPKLLDFGIAKLLVPGMVPHTVAMTRVDMRVMTPQHASPEQAQGKPITTASDVYSLGVLLYQLLTGHRPYRFASHRPGDIERAICETQPTRPSTAVGHLVHDADLEGGLSLVPENISAARATTTDKLKRLLSGDIDNIVLKALRKEPQRRYASVQEFSDDIGRYLRKLPVEARPDTWRYRTGKYLQRHAVAVAMSLVLVLAVAGLVTFYTVQLADQRDRARLEAEKAEQIAAFLAGMFEVSDPYRSKGETITARELLDQGAERIGRELDRQPVVQARLMDVIGRVYQQLGLYDSAETLLEDALALRVRELGQGHVDVIKSRLHIGDLIADTGSPAKARRMYQGILEQRLGVFPAAAPEVAEVLLRLAETHYYEGDYEAAESFYRQAVEIYRDQPEFDPDALSDALNGLGAALRHRGDYVGAEALYRDALEITQRRHGRRHPDVAQGLNHLSRLYYQLGDYGAAEPLAMEALEIRLGLFASEHPAVAASSGSLAAILQAKGDYEGAEVLRREVLRIMRGNFGTEHLYVAASLNSLGSVLVKKRDYDAAQPLLEESLALHRKLLPPDSPTIARSLVSLGALWSAMGIPARAELLLAEALELLEKGLPQGHTRIAEAKSLLGEALLEQGRYEQAEPLLRESQIVLEERLGAEHASAQEAGARVLRLYRVWGRPESAALYEGDPSLR